MIEIKNVIKKYENKIALNPVSMDINNADIVGVIGANGAGKSTFMRLLAGVLLPDSGSIWYDGKPFKATAAMKEKIFFFPDEPYFFMGSTIKETAKFYAVFYKSFDTVLFNRLCESFELNPKEKISKLSKGMKRQVIMLIGISIRPAYMLLDEVFDGIDSVSKQTLKKAIERLVCEYGTTVITASHNVREIEDVCRSVCMIYKSNMVLYKDLGLLKRVYEENTDPLSLEEILTNELEVLGYASKNVDFI